MKSAVLCAAYYQLLLVHTELYYCLHCSFLMAVEVRGVLEGVVWKCYFHF